MNNLHIKIILSVNISSCLILMIYRNKYFLYKLLCVCVYFSSLDNFIRIWHVFLSHVAQNMPLLSPHVNLLCP